MEIVSYTGLGGATTAVSARVRSCLRRESEKSEMEDGKRGKKESEVLHQGVLR